MEKLDGRRSVTALPDQRKRPLVAGRKTAILLIVLMVASTMFILCTPTCAAREWSMIGTYSPGSIVFSLACGGTNLYAGCDNGTVYQNDLSGGAWTQTGSNTPGSGSAVSALAYDGTDLFAGCGDTVYQNDLSGGYWTQTGSNTPGSYVYALAYDGSNLYAGCGDGYVYQNDLSGGAWAQTGSDTPDPGSGSPVHALAYDGANLYAGCENGAVYQNDLSGGSAWKQTGSDTPAPPGSLVHALAYDGANLYAGCNDGNVRQNDLSGGSAWTQTGSNTPGDSVFALAYDGANLYAGCYNGAVYQNDLSGGSAWTQTGSNTPGSGIYALAYDGTDLYAGCTNGIVYRNDLSGGAWSQTGSDTPGSGVRAIIHEGSILYAGCENGTVFQNDLSGGTWSQTGSNTPGDSVFALAYDGTNLYEGCYNGAVYQNDLSGGDWTQTGNNTPASPVYALAYDGTNLYAGCYNGAVYQKNLSGGDWTQTGSDAPGSLVFSLAYDGSTLYAGCLDGAVYQNDLSGSSAWDQTGSDTPGSGVRAIIHEGSILYAGCDNGAVYQNDLSGGAWAQTGSDTPAPGSDVFALAYDGTNLYAGCWNGTVYRNDLSGGAWTQTGSNTPGSGIYALAYDGTDLYAGCSNGTVHWIGPTTPSLQTNTATSITTSGANLNGNITNTGGEDCNYRGFQYRQQGSGTWLGLIEDVGPYPAGPYSMPVSGLSPGTTYEFKAMAHNSAGWGEGGVLTFTTGQIPDPITTPKWYLAEGTSAWGFTTYITIENPNSEACTAAVTYNNSAGPVTAPAVALPPLSQTTINPQDVVPDQDFSTEVTCREGKTIAVDRTMSWTGPGAPSPEGHNSIGVTSPSATWYLPEGSSEWGFETWLLIQNPNATEATCTVTYMTEQDGPIPIEHKVPPNSRKTFNMEEDIGSKDASIEVDSDIPVIPERAMYRNNRREGHVSIGTTSPASDYYLAEGTSAWGFTTYVLVQNPQSTPTDVTITYMTPGGPVTTPTFQMDANSRKTVRVNDIPEVSNTDLSTKVHGSQPIIAERAMYWGEGTPLGEACHDSIGMDSPHMTFYLPDGEAKIGAGVIETWTLVANPNDSDVSVEISYLTPTGVNNVTFTETVPANSRRTFDMEDRLEGRAAVLVTSKTAGKPIMVERAMYWADRGAGTDTIGGFSD